MKTTRLSWGLRLAVSIMIGGAWSSIQAEAEEETAMAVAVQGDMEVTLEYTLTVDGAVVDSSEGKPPFRYIHGRHQLIPGLEQALTGLHVGDHKDVTVPPEDGYGSVDSAAFVEIPKSKLPPDLTPAVGMVLRGVNPTGQTFQATISALKDESVTLNLNHPLAGKTLAFAVKVVEISPAPAQ